MLSRAPENRLAEARYGRLHLVAGDVLKDRTTMRFDWDSAKQRSSPPSHPLENRVLLVDLNSDLALEVALDSSELAGPSPNSSLNRAVALTRTYGNIKRNRGLISLR